ncbi:1492_t:CDS:1 [Acaulospora morrowiae]|uniref:1492_t:CDS:1 n=1 Tax=Acaulospora morrowiae TaxID=94023 RepID=A0A9N9GVH9_9GLOM|nr:1492_t:CDS:1 [Acaulospora morrowiae]
MGCGNSLTDDLKLMVNNPRYSDIKLICKNDSILYGNRTILIARSEVFKKMLSMETANNILFLNFDASHIEIILEYLYTGSISEKITIENTFGVFNAAKFFKLKKLQVLVSEFSKKMNEHETQFPELSSKADNDTINYLIDSMVKVSWGSIEFDILSLQDLQYLLSKRDKRRISESSEYSVLRFAILSAANKISQEAFFILEKRLPPWKKINQEINNNYFIEIKNNYLIEINNNHLIEKELSTSIADSINPITEYIDFRRIDGVILKKVIEPLNIAPGEKISDAYRFQVSEKPSSSVLYIIIIFCTLFVVMSILSSDMNTPQNGRPSGRRL